MRFAGSSSESPRSPLKGSFKVEIDRGVDIDVDVDSEFLRKGSFKGILYRGWLPTRTAY